MELRLPRTPEFLGHQLPALDQSDESWANLAHVSECGKKLIFALNEIEYRVFSAISAYPSVRDFVAQRLMEAGSEPTTLAPPDLCRGDRQRKHNRTRMKAMACIQDPAATMTSLRSWTFPRGVSFRGRELIRLIVGSISRYPTHPGRPTSSCPAASPGAKTSRATPTNTACSTSAVRGLRYFLLRYFSLHFSTFRVRQTQRFIEHGHA